ncbi:MAG: hypothetical protein LBK61_01190 [Spirochaetaceae bacterium]|jgi:hypothetical protein|nr:hypothetical protein [Spirochaetaceae bacterium]
MKDLLGVEDEPAPEGPATEEPGNTPYAAKGVPVAGAEGITNIKSKFGVAKTGAEGVKEAFLELGAFIQNGGLETDAAITNQYKRVIQLGDWIALEGGLEVKPYGAGGVDKTGYFEYSPDDQYWNKPIPEGTYQGKLNQLIVVGINSFNEVNDNDTPHVVFQFQHIPVKRRMNTTGINTGGYPASEMREYLVPVTREDQLVEGSGNFLAGLIKAGVPEGVLWGPARVMATKSDPPTETITDLLWLPTEWEMFGTQDSSINVENAQNQARLEYYVTPTFRRKGNPSIMPGMINYWLASATTNSGNFCAVDSSAGSNATASTAHGVAPAFCVQGWIQQ